MSRILYEDNHIIVVVKPQNMPVCADSSEDPDLLGAIRDYLRKKYNKPGNVFVGLVHRLDRPTGGVMVFAKTSKAASRLSEALRGGDIEKRYYAVTVGTPRERSATLVDYLVKDTATNTVRVCPRGTEGAKEAVLSYHVLAADPQVALLDVRLATGRAHQIRVQLKNIGHPVFGDVRYGGDIARGYDLALWAYELRFSHPVTKEIMRFRASPPVYELPWSRFRALDAIFSNVTANADTVRHALPNVDDDTDRIGG